MIEPSYDFKERKKSQQSRASIEGRSRSSKRSKRGWCLSSTAADHHEMSSSRSSGAGCAAAGAAGAAGATRGAGGAVGAVPAGGTGPTRRPLNDAPLIRDRDSADLDRPPQSTHRFHRRAPATRTAVFVRFSTKPFFATRKSDRHGLQAARLQPTEGSTVTVPNGGGDTPTLQIVGYANTYSENSCDYTHCLGLSPAA